MFLAESARILIYRDTSVIVSGGLDETALKFTSDKVSYIKELNSNQEEADTRLLLHVYHEAKNGEVPIDIKSPDTDILSSLCTPF